jgi:hypothetical protein
LYTILSPSGRILRERERERERERKGKKDSRQVKDGRVEWFVL